MYIVYKYKRTCRYVYTQLHIILYTHKAYMYIIHSLCHWGYCVEEFNVMMCMCVHESCIKHTYTCTYIYTNTLLYCKINTHNKLNNRVYTCLYIWTQRTIQVNVLVNNLQNERLVFDLKEKQFNKTSTQMSLTYKFISPHFYLFLVLKTTMCYNNTYMYMYLYTQT